MKTVFAAMAVSAAFLATPALAAQNGAPPYTKGRVWDVVQIKTKDGHFDQYMRWLDSKWKPQEEALKKAGYITGYNVYVIADPRPGEPDILLATQFKNMAAFDTPVAEMYSFATKQFGSAEKANKEEAARGSIRTVMGEVMMREVHMK